MKKISIILTLVLVTFGTQAMAATQKKNTHRGMTAEEIRRYNIRRFDIHNLSVWGGVGYSDLLHKSATITNGLNYTGDFSNKAAGCAGGYLGVGYEYNYKHFLLSVGPEFRLLSSSDKLNWTAPYTIGGLEYEQTKKYYLNSGLEKQLLGEITLPVMVGGQWDKVYVKGGVKLGYAIMANYNQSVDVQGTILDKMAYEEWKTPMSHYNAGTTTQTIKGKTPFGLDVALTAEVGINLDQLLGQDWRIANEALARPNRMRIGVFVDYGLNNMSVKTDQAMATFDAYQLSTQSWLTSEWGPSKINSLLVGVKFTYLLQMNKVKKEMKQNGYLAVYTYDDMSLAALSNVAVQITNTNTKKVSRKTTNSRGLLSARQPEGDYRISAQRNGYESVADMAFAHSNENDTARIGMHKIVPPPAPEPEPVVEEIIVPQKEQPIILENLFFATNETTILPQSEPSLNMLYTMLVQHPQIRIRITGHTDSVGKDEDNQRLSEGRANSVRQAMIDRGIDPARIEAEGKGETEPIDTNDTEEGRQHNRRVEFMVL